MLTQNLGYSEGGEIRPRKAYREGKDNDDFIFKAPPVCVPCLSYTGGKGGLFVFLSISEIRLLETISEDFVNSFVCWLHVSLNMYKGVHLVAEHCLYTSS